MINKIFYYLAILTFVLVLSITLYMYYLTFYPFKIVKFNRFEVAQKEVLAGESIQLYMDFEKFYDYKADIKFYIVDGVSYLIPSGGTHRKTGKNTTIRDIKIPSSFEGTYHVEVALSYQITPFRQINYVIKSNEFEIINSK